MRSSASAALERGHAEDPVGQHLRQHPAHPHQDAGPELRVADEPGDDLDAAWDLALDQDLPAAGHLVGQFVKNRRRFSRRADPQSHQPELGLVDLPRREPLHDDRGTERRDRLPGFVRGGHEALFDRGDPGDGEHLLGAVLVQGAVTPVEQGLDRR